MARPKPPTPTEEAAAHEAVCRTLAFHIVNLKTELSIAHANGGSFTANGGQRLYEGVLRAQITILEQILGQLS